MNKCICSKKSQITQSFIGSSKLSLLNVFLICLILWISLGRQCLALGIYFFKINFFINLAIIIVNVLSTKG